MGYQSITRLSPSILSGFPENYLVPSYTPLTTWLCIFSIKIASILLTKVWEKIIYMYYITLKVHSQGSCLIFISFSRWQQIKEVPERFKWGAALLYLSWTDSIGTHFALLTHFLFWLYQGLALVRHITEHFFSSKVILTCNLLTPKGD